MTPLATLAWHIFLAQTTRKYTHAFYILRGGASYFIGRAFIFYKAGAARAAILRENGARVLGGGPKPAIPSTSASRNGTPEWHNEISSFMLSGEGVKLVRKYDV